MARDALAGFSAAHSSLFFRGLLIALTGAVFVNSLSADRFRGQARHEFLDQQPVAGAVIEMVDAADPEQTATVLTDALGYFETSVFDAGDQINITATHPAYQQETPVITLDSTDHFESILMTPLGDVTTDYHDVIVQVSGAVTQLPLREVPIEVTRWASNSGGAPLATYSLTTDAKGIVYLRGARNGFYEFKINDSSLPDGERNPRYEDYATPLLERVEVTTDHFTNVFLKPLKQDLRVLVKGYNFLTKNEENEPLDKVLVEIRGMDPHDTDVEVLHTRSDFTKVFSADADDTVTNDEILLNDGEVVFQGLPPAAYEVKVTRFGYITQTILLEPDAVTGLLPNDLDNPLLVDLPHEDHALDILLDFTDYVEATYRSFGGRDSSGVEGRNLRVRVVGVEGTNTEGLEFESRSGLIFNDPGLTRFDEPILSGRYRVYVDGICRESPLRYNEDAGFGDYAGPAYDIAAFGEALIEIPVGHEGTFTELHRITVELETPDVHVSGKLVSAETVEPKPTESGVALPIFRPHAEQTVVFTNHPADNLPLEPTTVTTTTDAEGRFSVRLPPGNYGIRLPGMEEYFGDRVIVLDRDEVPPADHQSFEEYLQEEEGRSWEWPLAEEFPDVPGVFDEELFADRYFALYGMPINAGRDQTLELRVRRERYRAHADGGDNTNYWTRLVAFDSEGPSVGVDYSPALLDEVQPELQSDNGNQSTRVELGNFGSLSAAWDNLPPGTYDEVLLDVPAHDFSMFGFSPRTFLDWPVPGDAPSVEQAVLFDLNQISGNGDPDWYPEPLESNYLGEMQLSLTPYEAMPYSIYEWGVEEVGGQLVEGYHLQEESSFSQFAETSFGSGYWITNAAPGGPVTAIWTKATNDDGEEYWTRLTPGMDLFNRGPSPSPPAALPDIAYTLELHGAASADPDLSVNGAHFSIDGQPIQTGGELEDLRTSPFLNKESGDNFYVTNTGPVRWVSGGATPRIAITVELEQGMQVTANLRDMSALGGLEPADVPAPPGLRVEIRNRYGRILDNQITDDEGQVKFESLPGFADYYLTMEVPGYTPVRTRLAAADAMESADTSTIATHDITQEISLLTRPTLHDPGVPHNRWGLFLPTVSRSGNVNAEKGINDYNFFAARDALTTTWKVEVTPHQLNLSLPAYSDGSGVLPPDEVLDEPDAIVAAFLIDERRFQKDGFVGGTDPLEGETVFDIPPDDNEAEWSDLVRIIKETVEVPEGGNSGEISPGVQRRVFFDEADSITIDAESGRTVVTGTMPLWDLPPGKFDPVIVLETRRGAYRVYDVPYDGDDKNKQLRAPDLPPWFAGILDLLGLASGITSTDNRLEKAFKNYVPKGGFVPLSNFGMNITVDKPDAAKDEGYLQYALDIGMAHEIGQSAKSDGMTSLGPGLVGGNVKVMGRLFTDGRNNRTSFTVSGEIKGKGDFITESYVSKLGPPSASRIEFGDPVGRVSTTASTNYGTVDETESLNFTLDAYAGFGASVSVIADLNEYGRAIPYAGPVIGLLGTTKTAELDAFIEGRGAIAQNFTLDTAFPRERRVRTITRDEPLPLHSFLGETKIKVDSELCIGIGFATGLKLSVLNGRGKADLKFDVGGDGCQVNKNFSTMELKLNTDGEWPLISEISGKAAITASASSSLGPAKLKGKWTFAETKFDVQFGTDTIVTHFPFTTDYELEGNLDESETPFTEVGPGLVNGIAPAADFGASGGPVESLVFTSRNPTTGFDVLVVSQRVAGAAWSTPVEIELAPRVGETAVQTLADGRLLVSYTVIADGEDDFDPYADHQILSRTIATDGTVSAEIPVADLDTPPTQILLAESGDVVELHTKAANTDGDTHGWRLYVSRFDANTNTWDDPVLRATESEDFDLNVAAGGSNGADEIIAHWVLENGTWKWQRTSDASSSQVEGTFSAAPAVWSTASGYEIIVPTTENTLARFTQSTGSGSPTRHDDLAEGVAAVEVGLSSQAVTPLGGYLLAWAERFGNRQVLSYLTYGPDGDEVSAIQPITDNTRGEYSDLLLTRQTDTNAHLFARYTDDEISSLRVFAINVESGLGNNDADLDNLPDTAEIRIADSDTTDDIRTISDVLDGDDFDGDGVTNGDEIRFGTDPLDPFSTPNLPEILTSPSDLSVSAGDPASFTVVAEGDDLTYQWHHNGIVLPGAVGSTLDISSAQTTDGGVYVVTVSNENGSVRSAEALLTVTGGDAPPVMVVHGAGSAEIGPGERVYLPFRIDGSGDLPVLLRALGPALSDAGPTEPPPVADPALVLRDSLGFALAENDNWQEASDGGTAADQAATSSGALPLTAGSPDAALVANLAPGRYTLEASADGVGLIYIEILDLNESTTPEQRLTTLGLMAPSAPSGVLATLGFTVPEPGSRDVVTRYRGSADNDLNLFVDDPQLDLYRNESGSSTLIGSNDNWESGNLPLRLATSLPDPKLEIGSRDAARIDRLGGGSYQLVANLESGDSGFGFLEIVDPFASETLTDPVLLALLRPDSVTIGSSATFHATAIADGALTYQWTHDGQPIADATDSSLVVPNVTEDASGDYAVQLSADGNTVTSAAFALTVTAPSIHDADTDGDFRLNLSELLRVIELYNTRFGTTRTGRYRLQNDTTDGFAPENTTTDDGVLTRYHTADTDRNAKLSLSELLRVIEIYNTRSGTTRTGAYRAAEDTIDGFTPDLEASN
ncbi:MAG: hypothetical protein SynsKO_08880 [Synoicihabitans sp.]